ncbi:MAG: phosphoribosylformylglycinamidine cyclo-ligase [Actinomycetota bacterium]
MNIKRVKGDSTAPQKVTYADAGVDIHAGRRAVDLIKGQVRSTFRPEVIGDIGGFGGAFAFDKSRFNDPLLVSGTDGVGTKIMIADMMKRYDTIGIDLVAMSVNDVLSHGAEPLFFLDYIVTDKVDPKLIEQVMIGIAEGCRDAGCALIGGEIAEHPGHMKEGTFDLAGFCVGAVDRSRLVTGQHVREGDVIVGIASSGMHSNGFSLARKILLEEMGLRLDDRPIQLSTTLGEELLKPTLIYSSLVRALTEILQPNAIAHITGGGLPENVSRLMPAGLKATIRADWEVPRIFELIMSLGQVDRSEMFATFNMGIGLVVIVPDDRANLALDVIRSNGHGAYEIGQISAAGGKEPAVQLA